MHTVLFIGLHRASTHLQVAILNEYSILVVLRENRAILSVQRRTLRGMCSVYAILRDSAAIDRTSCSLKKKTINSILRDQRTVRDVYL